MNYLILIFIVITSTEILIKFDYASLIKKLIKLNTKAFKIIINKRISDHWKEKIIQQYSFEMIKLSISLLFVLFLIIFLFIVLSFLSSNFLEFTLNIRSLLATFLFAFGYIYLKKSLKK